MKLKLKLRVKKILKSTNAVIFKDLRIGDEILLSCSLDEGYMLRSGYRYAPKVTITNLRNNDECQKPFKNTNTLLAYFEFEEII